MSQFTLTRLPKSTLKIAITIPWVEVEVEKKKVVSEAAKSAEIKGFRKGQAPADLVEKSLDPAKINQQILQSLIPQLYSQAVKELNLKPIMLPQIHLESTESAKDWIFHALTCEAPPVQLNGFKDKLKGHFASAQIWTPQKQADDQAQPNSEEDNRQEKLVQLIDWLLKNIDVDPPDLLIEEEANHMLTRLLDQLQQLGLTVEQYLASKTKTQEQLRVEYAQTSRDNLKLELILNAIASDQNLQISQEELQKWIDSADPATKDTLTKPQSQASLKTVLLRRKTLDFLLTLT